MLFLHSPKYREVHSQFNHGLGELSLAHEKVPIKEDVTPINHNVCTCKLFSSHTLHSHTPPCGGLDQTSSCLQTASVHSLLVPESTLTARRKNWRDNLGRIGIFVSLASLKRDGQFMRKLLMVENHEKKQNVLLPADCQRPQSPGARVYSYCSPKELERQSRQNRNICITCLIKKRWTVYEKAADGRKPREKTERPPARRLPASTVSWCQSLLLLLAERTGETISAE